MARKVAHEIKNPLTPIQLSAEHVLKVYEDKRGDLDTALKESMSYIISEVENLRRIAQEFMEIARDTTVRKEPVDLRALLEETVQPYRRLLDERIRFRVVAEGTDFGTRGDPAKLKTALRNIVANAVEAIGARGQLDATIGRRDGVVAITISDSGPGMSRETVERIFDMYFSTKDGGTVEAGRGILDLPLFLRTLAGLDYRGTAAFEFEKDGKDPLPGLAESLGYVRGILAAREG